MGGFLCTTVNTKLFHFFFIRNENLSESGTNILWACLHRAKAKKIKEQLEEIKEKNFKHQRKFSLLLGVNRP